MGSKASPTHPENDPTCNSTCSIVLTTDMCPAKMLESGRCTTHTYTFSPDQVRQLAMIVCWLIDSIKRFFRHKSSAIARETNENFRSRKTSVVKRATVRLFRLRNKMRWLDRQVQREDVRLTLSIGEQPTHWCRRQVDELRRDSKRFVRHPVFFFLSHWANYACSLPGLHDSLRLLFRIFHHALQKTKRNHHEPFTLTSIAPGQKSTLPTVAIHLRRISSMTLLTWWRKRRWWRRMTCCWNIKELLAKANCRGNWQTVNVAAIPFGFILILSICRTKS